MTLSETNTGEMFGNPPAGKSIIASGFDLFRISNVKIIELWSNIIMENGHKEYYQISMIKLPYFQSQL
jgi:predicted ester cyclase